MKTLFRIHLATALLVATGCSSFLKSHYADTVPAPTGSEVAAGLAQPVRVSRDSLGIPLIEAESESDLAFAAGWVAAEDRLSQMLGMRTMAQGRLAEFFGEELLDIDVYLRTLDLMRVARTLYEPLSEDSKARFARYAEGVNAYLASHPLPPDLQLAGTPVEPWAPTDSMAVFALFNLGLAFNLHEELAYLRLAEKLGAEKAAWLVPIYPDEPLPFEEAKKLEGIDLSVPLDALEQLQPKLATLHQRPFAASNNWAVHKSRTKNGASILANDTHVPLAMPSYWHYVHLVAPSFHAAGVALAGIPGVVAGYNLSYPLI